jgi:hypothetical protein
VGNCFYGLSAAETFSSLPISPMSSGRKQPLLVSSFEEGKTRGGRGGVDSVEWEKVPLSNQPDRCRTQCLILMPCAISPGFGADPLGNPAAISASGLRPMVLRTALSCRLPFSSGEIPMKMSGSITNRPVKERKIQIRLLKDASSVHIYVPSGNFF